MTDSRNARESPFVSVLMPLRNEGAFVRRSVGSVLAQDYPHSRMEVLIADGMSTDGTRAEIDRLAGESDVPIAVCDNPRRIVATGLNVLLGRARGDILVRVDGHCEVAPDYVSRCVEHLERGEAEGVGGPLETIGQGRVPKAIALAMSSPFGVGGAAFRTSRGDRSELVDTVPFPAYTREVVQRAGPFDEELVRNQDDEYNSRLRSLGARILLAADVRSRYYSRSGFRSLWRQYFQYGYWKVRVLQKHPRQMKARQFVPPAFVACLVGTLAFSLVSRWGLLLFAAGSGAYVLANLLASAGTARRRGSPEAFPLLSAAFAVLHFAYGFGFLVGLVRFVGRWGRRREATPMAAESRGEAL